MIGLMGIESCHMCLPCKVTCHKSGCGPAVIDASASGIGSKRHARHARLAWLL